MTKDKFSHEIPTFVIDRPYHRATEITGKFGGNGQSGIAPSRVVPAIFLFTGNAGIGYGYEDAFDSEGCLLYTGEGQEGDMSLTRGNAAITTHALDGRALHVFKSTGRSGPYLYKGEFTYGTHFTRRGLDKNKRDREIIIFRLIPTSRLSLENQEIIERQATEEVPIRTELSLEILRKRAIDACKGAGKVSLPEEMIRTIYERSAQVRAYVLARAAGQCELCSKPAPFNRKGDGTPYLESHHINRLSDGGLDHPAFIGAVCPNCHRRVHFGVDGRELNDFLRARITQIEGLHQKNWR